MATDTMRVKITGTSALLMHSNQGVNPRHPLSKQLKTITSKRTKSDEDIDQIARLEWELGMYYDPQTGPYLPAEMLLACLRDAAKRTKQGKQVLESVWFDDARIPLQYEGPRDIESMYTYDDGKFFDLRPARVQGRTVNRARPIFPQWSAEFTISFDSEFIDGEDIQRILEDAGRRTGLGDYRPIHGRFVATFGAGNGKRKVA